MRKRAFLIISLIAFLNFADAQSSFGIEAGATFASIRTKESEVLLTTKSSTTKTGFAFGLVYSVNIHKNFTFRPELNFVQKGGILKQNNPSATNKITYNYLELPLSVVYQTYSRKEKFFVGIGPVASLGLTGKNKIKNPGEDEFTIHFKMNGNEGYYAFEFGLNALAGYQFSRIFFAINYNYGLTKTAPIVFEKDYNTYFGLKAGYMFSFKKK
ncbi:MAG: porin family protein [Parafilimonas sp.]